MAPSLTSLPYELLIATTQDLTARDYLALAVSCKTLSSIAIIHLYRRVCFVEKTDHDAYNGAAEYREDQANRSPPYSRIFDIIRFAELIQEWPELRRHVHEASLFWVSTIPATAVADAIHNILALLEPYRPQIHIAPQSLHRWGSQARLDALPIARLLQARYPLASVDFWPGDLLVEVSPEWRLDVALATLFQLSTLRKVQINCKGFHDFNLFPKHHRPELAKSSTVKHLAIRGFDGRYTDLTEVLHWPAGLEVFSLTTGPWARTRLNELSPDKVAHVLLPQAETLASLDLVFVTTTNDFNGSLAHDGLYLRDLRAFRRLQSLGIPYDFLIQGGMDLLDAHRPPRGRWEAIRQEMRKHFHLQDATIHKARRVEQPCEDRAVDLVACFPPSLRHLQIQSCCGAVYLHEGSTVAKQEERDAYRLYQFIGELPHIKALHLPLLETMEVWEPCAFTGNRPPFPGKFAVAKDLSRLPALHEADIRLAVTVDLRSPLQAYQREGRFDGPGRGRKFFRPPARRVGQ